MNVWLKVAMVVAAVVYVGVGTYAICGDLLLRNTAAQVAKREAESSASPKASRDRAFHRFQECVRGGETWNNCIEER